MGNARDYFSFGVTTQCGPFAIGELSAVADAVGRPLDFTAVPQAAALDSVAGVGAQPVITWEPWRWDGRRDPILQRVRSGRYDSHLRRWAATLRTWGSPVALRFGHEFNGHWYPWSAGAGIRHTLYVEVWHHVHEVITTEGATNVRWVWSPTAGLTDGPPLEPWYPGDDYVDVIGVDGYNWGSSQQWSRWVEPEELFDSTLEEVRTVAGHLPLLITEVACAEAGGSKPGWIGTLLSYLVAQPDVEGLIWFDHDKETDWRITRSAASAAPATSRASTTRSTRRARRPSGASSASSSTWASPTATAGW